jgi:hypothetical protein
MSANVVWCDQLMRFSPRDGAPLDSDGQAARPPVRLTSGRNQFVSFQLLVGPIRKDETVSVSPDALTGPRRARLGPDAFDVFVEWPHQIADKWWPDALVPQDVAGGGSTPAFRKRSGLPEAHFAVFWVDLFVPAGTAAGRYAGSVTVRIGSSLKLDTPVELDVFPASIGAQAALDLSFNNYADAISGGWPALRDAPGHLATAHYRRVERGVFRAAHDHRGFLHYLPYGHSGYIHPGFAPPLAGEGPGKHVADWAAWDRHFGPYFDGTAFAGSRRGAVPTARFYLPLNLDWPADFVKFGRPGYEAEWRAVGRDIVRHFRERKWTRTTFDMFLNHKQGFRFFPWDTEECRFLEDQEIHRIFGKLWQGTYDRATTGRVRFDYTLGTTWSYGWDIRSDLVDIIDVFIASGTGPSWYAAETPRVHAAGGKIWFCTNSGSILQSPCTAMFSPLQAWRLGLDGLMPSWASLMWGDNAWHQVPASGGTTFFYPGSQFGTDDTYPSLRVKAMRNMMQTVDHLALAASRVKGGRAAVAAQVDQALGFRSSDWYVRRPKGIDSSQPHDWTNASHPDFKPKAAWSRIHESRWRNLPRLALGLASGEKP